MESIVIRGLDQSVQEQLAAQAAEHGRSLEAEIRDIVTTAVRRPNIALALLQAARAAGGVDDLLIPERTDLAQAVDFA